MAQRLASNELSRELERVSFFISEASVVYEKMAAIGETKFPCLSQEMGTDEVSKAMVEQHDRPASTDQTTSENNAQPLSVAQITDADDLQYADVHKGFPRKVCGWSMEILVFASFVSFSTYLFCPQLFSVLEKEEYNDILSWLPHGRGFSIKDRERLTNVILPKVDTG